MTSALDARFVKNNDIALKYIVKNPNGSALDLTSFTAIKWQMKKNHNDIALISKTLGDGIEILKASAGIFAVYISAEDTKNLKAGTYKHEAILTDSLGKSVTLTDSDLQMAQLYLREQVTSQT